MKRLVVGTLAHIDAGKTMFSERLLYTCGRLRQLGRVDHKNAFLGAEALEREYDITTFSKQAVLPSNGLEITLFDIPDRMGFSSETERTLQVLDYAIPVISGSDDVQSHARMSWRLFSRYRIPASLFTNRMGLSDTDHEALLHELKAFLLEDCVDSGADQGHDAWMENVAVCNEEATSRYPEQGEFSDTETTALVARRKVFPCYSGSALRLSGVDELVRGLMFYTQVPEYPQEFAARVFKVTRDAQRSRLTYLKVTGGTLRVKMPLKSREWEEKIGQIRIYPGTKFQPVDEAPVEAVCAVTGLSQARAGEGLGAEGVSEAPTLEPMLTYRVVLLPDYDPHSAVQKLSALGEGGPQFHLVWNAQLREISL